MPLKILQTTAGKVLFLWPRALNPDNERARVLDDKGNYFSNHFEERYQSTQILAEFFLGDKAVDQLALARARFSAEKPPCTGRFSVKRSVHNLMIPPSSWEWEKEDLIRKYGPKIDDKILSDLRSFKIRRLKNFRTLLGSHKCYDICSLSTIQDFMRNDGLRTEADERPKTVKHRIAVIDYVLGLLAGPNYILALTDDEKTARSFEVAVGDSLFIHARSAIGTNRLAHMFHLRIHDTGLEECAQGHFLKLWDSLRTSEKDNQRTAEILRAERTELESQLA